MDSTHITTNASGRAGGCIFTTVVRATLSWSLVPVASTTSGGRRGVANEVNFGLAVGGPKVAGHEEEIDLNVARGNRNAASEKCQR